MPHSMHEPDGGGTCPNDRGRKADSNRGLDGDGADIATQGLARTRVGMHGGNVCERFVEDASPSGGGIKCGA